MPKPIKRIKALEEVSRDHHHGLLLSWKIRKGLKLNIALERMNRYVDWFWAAYLKEHFEIEEKYIFPVLDPSHQLIKQALKEHSRLSNLFVTPDKQEDTLNAIAEELNAHIRFEERVLFQEIQIQASAAQLEIIEKAHAQKAFTEWEDPFWLDKPKTK